MNVYMNKSIKRMIAAILCFVMFFNMLPVSAAKDSWKQKDGIRYRVEQTEIENGEEIYVAAETVRNDVELIGIELPDGQVEYSDGTYAEARFEAYSDGDYDFKILYRKLDLATESDADITTDSEPDRATPTDPDRNIATVTDAEPYEDEDGELIVPDMDIMSDKAITATAMKVQMSSDIPEADDVESIDISVNVNSLNSNVGISINWQDSNGDKLPDVNEVTYSNGYLRNYFAINFTLGGSDMYPAGSVKIIIPGGKKLKFYNKPTDIYQFNAQISVNNRYTYINTDKQTISGTVMDCYADGDDLVLVNNTAIQGGNYSFGTVLRYYTDNSKSELRTLYADIIPGEIIQDFHADIYINDDYVKSSNTVTHYIKTTAKLDYSTLSEDFVFYKWDDKWGAKPEKYDEDYFYLVHAIKLEEDYDQYVIVDGVSIVNNYRNNPDYEFDSVVGYAEINIGNSRIEEADVSGLLLKPFEQGIEKYSTEDDKWLIIVTANKRNVKSDANISTYTYFTFSGYGKYEEPSDKLAYSMGSQVLVYQQVIPEDNDTSILYFKYDEDNYSASSLDTALLNLKDNSSFTVPFRLYIRSTSFYHFNKANGPIIHSYICEDVYLGDEKLNPEDYSLNTSEFNFTGYSRYVENKYTGSLSEEDITSELNQVTEVKSIENNDWHSIENLKNTDESIYAIKYSVSGDYDKVYKDKYDRDIIEIELKPTDHVLKIINSKDSIELRAIAATKISGSEDLNFFNATAEASATLSGRIKVSPISNIIRSNKSLENDGYNNTLYFAFAQFFDPMLSFQEGWKGKNLYIAVPNYVGMSNIKAYYLDDLSTEQYIKEENFKEEILEDLYTINKLKEINGYIIYQVNVNADDKETDDKHFGYGIVADVRCPIEVIKANKLKSFIIKAAWQDQNGDKISSGDVFDSVQVDSNQSWKNGHQTMDDDLRDVDLGCKDFSEFENIDGNDTPNEIAVNSTEISFNLPETYELNYSVTTMGSLDSYYIEEATTEVGSEYRYRLRLSNSATSQRRNIVMYDNLEKSQGSNESWNGEFAGVDMQDFIDSYGVTPTIYYSTKKDLPVDIVPSEDELLGPDWSTICPADPSEVTAVIFDFGDFMLDVKQAMYVDIIMKAPSKISYADDGSNLFAYNESAYCSFGKEDGDESWDSVLTQKANLTRVKLVEPLVNITKTADPGPGTEDAPEMLSPGDTFDYYITVTNDSEFTVNDITFTDSIDDRLTFDIDDIRVKLNDGKFTELTPDIAELINISTAAIIKTSNSFNTEDKIVDDVETVVITGPDKNKITINIPSLRHNNTLTFKIPVTVPEDMENGSISNTAYLTSVGGKEVDVQSETTYHMVDDKSFIAGRGMRVFFDVISTGRSSIFEQTAISVKGIPEGTELELYRMEDCEITDKGWYVPKTKAVPIGIYSSSNSSITLDANALDGSQDDISKGKTVHHDYILYCSKGSMRDTDFTIDVSTHAVQYKNNFIENLANAIGFKDDDSVTIFDSKKL